MSTTITVAIITAISTLAGVTVTALVTFLMSRAQATTQIKLANSNRIEQRLKERQQDRKETYVQFLNQFSKAEQALDVAWQLFRPSTKEGFFALLKPVNAEINALIPHVNLVALEGPADVSEGCRALGGSLISEVNILSVITALCLSGEQISSRVIGGRNDFEKGLDDRREARDRVIKKMQETLEADAESRE